MTPFTITTLVLFTALGILALIALVTGRERVMTVFVMLVLLSLLASGITLVFLSGISLAFWLVVIAFLGTVLWAWGWAAGVDPGEHL